MPYERRNYGLQWVEPVPRIPDALINSIIYLYPDKLSAKDGLDFGASGFLLAMRSEAFPDGVGGCHAYAVTNKHVIETGEGYPVVRANLRHPSSQFEKTFIFEFTNDDWALDPGNDLAICPLPTDCNLDLLQCSLIAREMVLTREQCASEIPPIGPGDSVVYIGRFMGHAGKYENMPSVRFGNISMNPNEQEPIAWQTARRHYEQVGYLVEARSRSGYSGSPVFTLNQHVVNNKRSVIPWMDMRLLGVDWGHLPEKLDLTLRGVPNSTHWQAEVHSGMMGVVPSWSLLDFIDNSPRLIEQRRRDDEYYREHRNIFAKGVPDVSSNGNEQPNSKP